MALKNEHYLVIVLVAVIGFGYCTAWTFNPNNFALPIGETPTPTPTPASGIDPSATVSVQKALKLVVSDKHGGAAATGTTDSIDVYDSSGVNTMEANLDLSSGTVTTGNVYQSGEVLYIQYYYDTAIDEYMWWRITVPRMTPADAESLTTNLVRLEAFSSAAATDIMTSGAGATYSDDADLNVTGTSNDTGTFTYSWFITTDNTGYMTSYDPIYQINLKPVLWVTLTGTGYSTVSLTGFDGVFEKGSTMYYYHVIPDNDVTKYKVGNTYVLPGAGSFTWSYSASGYTANSTVMRASLEFYSDVGYMQTYGAAGPFNFTLCETEVDFEQLS